MEVKIDKKFIDEAVQKAVKDIKQNYISKDVLDKIRAEIAEYGSIMVAYAITEDTKTDKGIEKLVSDVLSETKRQVLDIIDKYKTESGVEE
jgi:hypothetical protein